MLRVVWKGHECLHAKIGYLYLRVASDKGSLINFNFCTRQSSAKRM